MLVFVVSFVIAQVSPEMDGAPSAFSSVEIHIPKDPRRDQDFLTQTISGILTENFQSIERFYREKISAIDRPFKLERTIQIPVIELILLSPFKAEMALEEQEIRSREKGVKQRRESLQQLRIKYLQMGREFFLSKLTLSDEGKKVLRDLEPLQLTIEFSMQIYPGLQRVETQLTSPDDDKLDELTSLNAQLQAKPILELETLNLSLENVILGDRSEINTDPILEEGALQLEPSLFDLRATMKIYDNLVSRRDDSAAAIASFPLVALKTNFASISIDPNNIDEIVRRAISSEQIQALLNAIQSLQSFQQLQTFANRELLAKGQTLNLELGIAISSDHQILLEPLTEELLTRVQALRDSKQLQIFGRLNLPVLIRDFNGKLDLSRRNIQATVALVHHAQFELRVEDLYIRTPSLALDQNLAEGGLALRAELAFTDVANEFEASLDWQNDRLVWNPKSVLFSLPVLDGIQIQRLELNDIHFDLTSPVPLSAQLQRAAPDLIGLLNQKLVQNDKQKIEEFIVRELKAKLTELKNQPLAAAGPLATLTLEEIQWPKDELDVSLSSQKDEGSVSLEASLQLPEKIVLSLRNIQTPEADLDFLTLTITIDQDLAPHLTVGLRARTEEKTKLELSHANLQEVINALDVKDIAAAGVHPHSSFSLAGAKAFVANGIEGFARLLRPSQIKGRVTAIRFVSGFGLELWIDGVKNKGAAGAVQSKIAAVKQDLAKILEAKLQEVLTQNVESLLANQLEELEKLAQSKSIVNLRAIAEKKISEQLASQTKTGTLSEAEFVKLQNKAEQMIRQWIATSISGNASVIEAAIKDFYDEAGEKQIQNQIDEVLVGLENPETPKAPAFTISASSPEGNLNQAAREGLQRSDRINAIIHLALFNDTLRANLSTLTTLLIEKAKENVFVNESFKLQLFEPISTSGKFLIVNETGDLELRIGLEAEQETILVQKVTSLLGLIPDGIASALAGEEVKVFRNVFAVPGKIVDLPLGLLANLNTDGRAELRAVATVNLSSVTEDSYSLEIEVKKLQILYVDPVTLVTKVALDIAIPSALEGFKQTMQFQRPILPVLGNQVTFELPAGEMGLVADDGRQAIVVRLAPRFRSKGFHFPPLVYEAFEPLSPQAEAPQPSATSNEPPSPWTLPSLAKVFVVPDQEGLHYSIYLTTADDLPDALKLNLTNGTIAPADYLRRFYQPSNPIEFIPQTERGDGFTNPKKGITNLMINGKSNIKAALIREFVSQITEDRDRQENLEAVLLSTLNRKYSPTLLQFLPDFVCRETGNIFSGSALDAALRWHNLRSDDERARATTELRYKDSLRVGDIIVLKNADRQHAMIYISPSFVWQKSKGGRLEFISIQEAATEFFVPGTSISVFRKTPVSR